MPWQETRSSSPETLAASKAKLQYWPAVFTGVFHYYYINSFLTLPFADHVWLGEIPLAALVQLPKMKLMAVVQTCLISLLPSLGLASGSSSPDSILTHPWALGVTVSVPALILIIALVWLPRVAYRRFLIVSVVVVATLDAAVTFWFDATSRLSIF